MLISAKTKGAIQQPRRRTPLSPHSGMNSGPRKSTCKLPTRNCGPPMKRCNPSMKNCSPTNEELETSKEEMQSINEELTTVNTELQTRVADLSRVNNDMNNLLAGTGIATVFVDHDLNILRFYASRHRKSLI